MTFMRTGVRPLNSPSVHTGWSVSASNKSDIIRVKGMVIGYYEKCGFVGNQSWLLITKQKNVSYLLAL
jgi:hypothetical protein